MANKPKDVKLDPTRGDEILKRMLKTKPETHKQMIKGGKTRKAPGKKC